ncbi:MAG: hypothetical protein WC506_06905 [Candidatus Micrarchaeia archaeon]
MRKRAGPGKAGGREAALANMLLLYLIVLAGALFLKNFIDGAGAYLPGSGHDMLWEKYDWPDTAYMARLVSQGMAFSQDPSFSSSAPMIGYFPPVFPAVAALIYKFTGDYSATFTLLSAMIWLAAVWLIAKDWEGWEMKIAVIVIVFFLTAYIEWPPVLNRLREIFAVLIMALMFKNPLNLQRWKNFLIFGALATLAQPVVALLAIGGYFFFDAQTGKIRIERKMALCLAVLAGFFIITYYGHALALLSNEKPQNYIGCAYTMPAYNSQDYMRLSFFYAIASVFFLAFLPTRELKIAYGVLVVASIALLAAQNFPQTYLAITSPIASDMCYQTIPFLAFFALFPDRARPGGKRLALARILLLAALLAQSMQSYSFKNSSGYGVLDKPETLFAPNSTAIAARYYLWDNAMQPYLIHFDFRLMSELALKNAPVRFAYSPVQQFYDPNGYAPDLQGIIMSFAKKDMEECSLHAENLHGRGIDYASFEIILDRSWQPESDRTDSWGYRTALEMENMSMISQCGMEPVLLEMGNRRQNYFIYRLEK